jgi:NADP-dependent 3-hydroxy acid dehydrogenase YdfG
LGNHDDERGLVIVTGASGGIGEVIALHLRERGFSVLVGVRRASVTYSSGTPAGEPL